MADANERFAEYGGKIRFFLFIARVIRRRIRRENDGEEPRKPLGCESGKIMAHVDLHLRAPAIERTLL